MTPEDYFSHPHYPELRQNIIEHPNGGEQLLVKYESLCTQASEKSVVLEENRGTLYSGNNPNCDLRYNGALAESYKGVPEFDGDRRENRNQIEDTKCGEFISESASKEVFEEVLGEKDPLAPKMSSFMWKAPSKEYAGGLEGNVRAC